MKIYILYISFFNCNNANRNTSAKQRVYTENFLNQEVPSHILFKNLQ